MRWRQKDGVPNGTERKITRFLWLPLTIHGETRWLERATIRQNFYCVAGCGYFYEGWDDVAWAP